MLQRFLIAVLLLIYISGNGPVQGYASEAEVQAFEYTAGGVSACDEYWNIDVYSCKDLQCGTPLASTLCPLDIDGQTATFQAVLDSCHSDVDCFYARLQEAKQEQIQAAADAAWLDPANLGTGAANLAETGVVLVGAAVSRIKPLQLHHFATNKNKKFSGRMMEIANKHGLDLEGDWNQESLPQQGRHAEAYHSFVLEEMKIIDRVANGDRETFLHLFELRVKAKVRTNPEMLYAAYWR